MLACCTGVQRLSHVCQGLARRFGSAKMVRSRISTPSIPSSPPWFDSVLLRLVSLIVYSIFLITARRMFPNMRQGWMDRRS